jgi:hypothetical protein
MIYSGTGSMLHLATTRVLCYICLSVTYVGTLQVGAWFVWLYSLCGSGITWYWVSVSRPANMAG